MFTTLRATLLCGLLAAVFALSGCESAEEKAERYYRSGMALLAAGDEERALVEFRNVFKHNGFHKEARRAYADTQLKRGEVGQATGQYLRLIEQYPDTVDVRVTLAELAMARGDWTEVDRHGRAAIALDPALPAAVALRIALEYRTAALARDQAARLRIAEEARRLLDSQPDSKVARRVLIDQLVADKNTAAALPQVDVALRSDPQQLDFQVLKLRLLTGAGDVAGSGAHLMQMSTRFPENEQVKSALIGWYLAQKDIDGAEAFLRQLAGPPSAPVEGHALVIQLLQTARGPEAARSELDRLIAETDGTSNADLYTALRATIDFESGRTDAAIGAMEAVVATAAESDQTRRIKTMLAKMLDASGDSAAARARVEEVLGEDPSHVEALKLRAGWRIADDAPGDAIVDLRNALNQNPRDPQILTLMAAAHERDGSLDLASERLALAVEVSGSAAPESLRYARFLQQQGRTQVAETVLTDAARVSPRDPEVLGVLAEVYLRQKNWASAQATVDALRMLGLPEIEATVQRLQAAVLMGQNRTEETLAFLQEQIGNKTSATSAIAMVVQTQVIGGNLGAARAALDDAIATSPEDRTLRLLSAGVDALTGNLAAAETQYRALIAEVPADDAPVRMLFGLLTTAGQPEAAAAVVDAGLRAAPTSKMLRWIKAGLLEKAGDVDGAIDVYERLYAEESSNVVIANNLASLITSRRDDAESLDRAFGIARRLRGSDVPAFQDTYGWIEYRRGNLREALQALEPAAAGMTDDPLVQFHLGMAYADLGAPAKAIAQFERVLTLAGDADLPQVTVARTRLKQLRRIPSPTPLPDR